MNELSPTAAKLLMQAQSLTTQHQQALQHLLSLVYFYDILSAYDWEQLANQYHEGLMGVAIQVDEAHAEIERVRELLRIEGFDVPDGRRSSP